MDKPDVDFLEGLSPAISIDQKSASRNPRSTVGTITEVFDYLRLLYARIGVQHDPQTGEVVERQTAQQIVDRIMELPAGARFEVLAPVVRGPQGRLPHPARRLRPAGLRTGPGGRRGARAGRRRRDRAARPLREPRHRGDRGPAGDARRDRAAPDRVGGSGAGPGRGPRLDPPGEPQRRLGRAHRDGWRIRGPLAVPGRPADPGRLAARMRCSPSASICTRRARAGPSRSWRRATSRSTPPTAPAGPATGSAPDSRWIPSWWCRTPR